jgi:hypothetical protein
MFMKKVFAMLLCVAVPVTLFAAENGGFKVAYDGGSLPDLKAGADVKLFVSDGKIRMSKNGHDIISVPATAVTEISYGQDVHRRVGAAVAVGMFTLGAGALLALAKSKKHFIGLTWDDGGKKGGAAFQADKNDYRGLLAGLEGVTGKKAVDSDAMSVKN